MTTNAVLIHKIKIKLQTPKRTIILLCLKLETLGWASVSPGCKLLFTKRQNNAKLKNSLRGESWGGRGAKRCVVTPCVVGD